MGYAKANHHHRRRRLRLIKTVVERLAKRSRIARPALTIPENSVATKLSLESLQKKLFTECRGNPLATLSFGRSGEAPESVTMDRPYLVVGSDESCDLWLDDDAVKPRHCYLQWINGHIFCCDIAPRANLFPDRNQPSSGRWVNQNPLSIGPYQLWLPETDTSQTPDYSPLDRLAPSDSDDPRLSLLFDGVEQVENIWPINRMLTVVGRNPRCKLRLNHKSIAQVQACLLRTPQGYWLVDLANNGTTGVNEQAICVEKIDVGDILRFGSFQVEVIMSEFQPVVPLEEQRTLRHNGTAKSLPPIRFDRQPASHPKVATDPPIISVNDEPLTALLTTIDEMHMDATQPRKTVAVSTRTRSKTGDVASENNPTTSASSREAIVGINDSLIADLQPISSVMAGLKKTTIQKSISDRPQPLAFGSQLSNGSVEFVAPAVIDIDSSCATESMPLTIAMIGLRHRSPLKAAVMRVQPSIVDATKTPDWNLSQCTNVDFFQDQCGVTRETELIVSSFNVVSPSMLPPPLPSITAEPAAGVSDEFVRDFVQDQKAQLAALKLKLMTLKAAYDVAAGKMISTRTRESLERPVVETLQCYEAMQDLLDRFTQSTNRNPD